MVAATGVTRRRHRRRLEPITRALIAVGVALVLLIGGLVLAVYLTRAQEGIAVDNIHLRIANDVYLFIQRTHELGTGLLGSVVALFSFAFILWWVSAMTPLPLFGRDLSFPGYLIVAALAYAAINPALGLGTFLAQLVLRKPIIAASTREFRVTGPWVDPKVDRVERKPGEPVPTIPDVEPPSTPKS